MFIYVLIFYIVFFKFYMLTSLDEIDVQKKIKRGFQYIYAVLSACINGYARDETPKSL